MSQSVKQSVTQKEPPEHDEPCDHMTAFGRMRRDRLLTLAASYKCLSFIYFHIKLNLLSISVIVKIFVSLCNKMERLFPLMTSQRGNLASACLSAQLGSRGSRLSPLLGAAQRLWRYVSAGKVLEKEF